MNSRTFVSMEHHLTPIKKTVFQETKVTSASKDVGKGSPYTLLVGRCREGKPLRTAGGNRIDAPIWKTFLQNIKTTTITTPLLVINQRK